MKITVVSALSAKQDVLVLGLFDDAKEYYRALDKNIATEIEEALQKKLFTLKFGEMYGMKVASQPYQKIVVMGLGKKEEMTSEHLRKAMGKAVKVVKGMKYSSFITNIVDLIQEAGIASDEVIGRAAAEGLVLADYGFVKYLSAEKQEKKKALIEVVLLVKKNTAAVENGVKDGKVIGEATNYARDLVNEPATVVNSVYLAKEAEKLVASNPKMKLTVLEKKDMEKLGMGALLGVNAGSENPPKLVIIEYNGGKGAATAFVGKGITFDSGGYNLKPTKSIEDMKSDMAGAAAVLGTISVAAKLGVKKNLLGVMPLCENMVSGHAQHPGNIVRAYNGKTIEIGNTDAEGRLILADALSYVEDKYKPEVMVDLATLTGACVVALGYYASGLMSTSQKLVDTLTVAGDQSGDRVWQLPMYEEYMDWMDGSITDLNNISTKGKGYEAGSITAAVFLSKFVQKAQWAHLDIAGPAYWGVDNDYVQKGATGAGVRVLSYYLLAQGEK